MATKKTSARRTATRGTNTGHTTARRTAAHRNATGSYTVPGLTLNDGHRVADLLQDRLNSLNDLQLTLKHVHWNVTGPHFIAVHEMIDPHVVEVRDMVDETAERMATLGVSPKGTPGEIVKNRSWDDYSLGRATTNEHLGALDMVYDGVVADHRRAQEQIADVDAITEDMLIGQIAKLELFQWFVRAHLETTGGNLSTGGTTRERTAARKASAGARKRG
ncbi:MAG: Dps family protein [Nocardioidaceae bacterium]